MSNPTIPNRWQPPPQSDPNLDISMKTIYQQLYGLEAQSVQGVVNGMAVASGQTPMTGSQKGIATGLATVSNVVATQLGDTPSNIWFTTQPSPSGGGKIDIFAWMPTSSGNNTPIANTNPVSVNWIAFGTPVQNQ